MLALLLCPGARAEPLRGEQIVEKTLAVDTWGGGDTEATARATIRDKSGGTRQLAFTARSRRGAPKLTESLLRFLSPPDLKGVAFLLLQRQGADDDRYLFLPELRRARRIAGNTRSSSFMGTDFSYADIDRRDVRDSTVKVLGETTIGKFPCYHLELSPRRTDAVYARTELWVRKDNFVTLKMLMFNQAGVLLKTLLAEELRRIGDRWFITRSRMTSHQEARTTELIIDTIQVRTDLPEEDFTVRGLERG